MSAFMRLDTALTEDDYDVGRHGGSPVMGDWNVAAEVLGLERYEAVFRENEINECVLPSLTAEDLEPLVPRQRRCTILDWSS